MIPIGRDRSPARSEVNLFDTLQREIDRVFSDFSRGLPTFNSRELVPSIDVIETDKEIEITAELPALEEKDIHINFADDILTIKGEKKSEKEEKDKSYRLVERSYGAFSRSLELPAGVNPDMIKANISKGVLKVSVLKPAPAQTKKIEVKAAA